MSSEAPETLTGLLGKRSPSKLKLYKFQQRVVTVDSESLRWTTPCGDARGFLNLRKNKCIVEAEPASDTRFVVRPVHGAWNGRVGSGASKVLCFDSKDSQHDRLTWIQAIEKCIQACQTEQHLLVDISDWCPGLAGLKLTALEKRLSLDKNEYSKAEFIEFFGESEGLQKWESAQTQERRYGRDGMAYTISEFIQHYGEQEGPNEWERSQQWKLSREEIGRISDLVQISKQAEELREDAAVYENSEFESDKESDGDSEASHEEKERTFVLSSPRESEASKRESIVSDSEFGLGNRDLDNYDWESSPDSRVRALTTPGERGIDDQRDSDFGLSDRQLQRLHLYASEQASEGGKRLRIDSEPVEIEDSSESPPSRKSTPRVADLIGKFSRSPIDSRGTHGRARFATESVASSHARKRLLLEGFGERIAESDEENMLAPVSQIIAKFDPKASRTKAHTIDAAFFQLDDDNVCDSSREKESKRESRVSLKVVHENGHQPLDSRAQPMKHAGTMDECSALLVTSQTTNNPCPDDGANEHSSSQSDKEIVRVAEERARAAEERARTAEEKAQAADERARIAIARAAELERILVQCLVNDVEALIAEPNADVEVNMSLVEDVIANSNERYENIKRDVAMDQAEVNMSLVKDDIANSNQRYENIARHVAMDQAEVLLLSEELSCWSALSEELSEREVPDVASSAETSRKMRDPEARISELLDQRRVAEDEKRFVETFPKAAGKLRRHWQVFESLLSCDIEESASAAMRKMMQSEGGLDKKELAAIAAVAESEERAQATMPCVACDSTLSTGYESINLEQKLEECMESIGDYDAQILELEVELFWQWFDNRLRERSAASIAELEANFLYLEAQFKEHEIPIAQAEVLMINCNALRGDIIGGNSAENLVLVGSDRAHTRSTSSATTASQGDQATHATSCTSSSHGPIAPVCSSLDGCMPLDLRLVYLPKFVRGQAVLAQLDNGMWQAINPGCGKQSTLGLGARPTPDVDVKPLDFYIPWQSSISGFEGGDFIIVTASKLEKFHES